MYNVHTSQEFQALLIYLCIVYTIILHKYNIKVLTDSMSGPPAPKARVPIVLPESEIIKMSLNYFVNKKILSQPLNASKGKKKCCNVDLHDK